MRKKGETVRERRDRDTVRVEGRGVRQWEKRGRKEKVRGDIEDERETVRRQGD